MNQLPESTNFLVRNDKGELVAKVPEILTYLRAKIDRTREKYNATDVVLLWCLNELSADISTKIWDKTGGF